MMLQSFMIECSLCGQQFNNNDKYLDDRKQRHEEHHTNKGVSRNNSVGEVKWLKDT